MLQVGATGIQEDEEEEEEKEVSAKKLAYRFENSKHKNHKKCFIVLKITVSNKHSLQ
jgi:hypothetical protein